jgi:hypothetical protein
MKLYEIKHRERFSTPEVEFLATLADLKKRFNALRKIKTMVSIEANEAEINTNVTKDDWVKLLQSDSPGTYCELTPVDFITKRSLLRQWVDSDE